MLSRKYYRMIANVLSKTYDAYGDAIVFTIADQFCVEFKRDNPNFKEDVFLKACGMEDV